MTSSSSPLSPIANLLGNLVHSDYLTDVINDLGHTMTQPDVTDLLAQYDELVLSFVDFARDHGGLSSTHYRTLRKLHEEIAHEIELKTAVSITAAHHQDALDVLEALSLLGGLTYNPQESISIFLCPQMLVNSLYFAQYMDSRSRQKHISEIGKVRRIQPQPYLDAEIVSPFVLKLRTYFQEHVRRILRPHASTRALTHTAVEYLPTSTDYYHAGIQYYGSRQDKGKDHLIFSTTSGILLPEEHYGADFFADNGILPIPSLYDSVQKNPVRAQYFNRLRQVGDKPRLYHYELRRSSIHFRATLKKVRQAASDSGLDADAAVDMYRTTAKRILKTFISRRGFGIYEITEFPSVLNYLTLGNSNNLIISSRDTSEAPIGHGFWLRSSDQSVRERVKFNPEAVVSSIIAATLATTLTRGDMVIWERSLITIAAGVLTPIAFLMARTLPEHKARARLLDIGKHLERQIKDNGLEIRIIKRPFQRIASPEALAEEVIRRMETERLS